MNQLLADKYHRLSPARKKSLTEKFSAAPRALRLLHFLDTQQGKSFGMTEIVNAVYNDKQVSFQTRQNRFFKLRQKMMDELDEQTSSSSSGHLFPLEKMYFDCRDQMHANHFHLAKKGFTALIKECREKNVFELLHLGHAGLIYCTQALNETDDQYRLLDAYDEAVALNNDLQQLHALHRRMYALRAEKKFDAVDELFDQVRAIVARRNTWPRFHYFLAYLEMTVSRAANGADVPKLREAVQRMEQLYRKHKQIPCLNYEAHYAEITLYHIHMTSGILAFASGDPETAYRLINSAFNIADQTPGIRIRKTDSLYVNLITVANGTGRYEQAIRISEKLIAFHREQKEEKKRLQAYATLAMIYTYSFDKLPCPDPEFLLGKLDEYIRAEKKSRNGNAGDAYATKAVFLFMLRRYDQVARIMRRKEVEGTFDRYGLPEYTELLKLNTTSPKTRVLDLKKRLQRKLKETRSTEAVQHYRRALKLLGEL